MNSTTVISITVDYISTGVSPGTAIANVNLATLDPNLRTKIRESSLQLEQKKDEVSFLELVTSLSVFLFIWKARSVIFHFTDTFLSKTG